MKSFVGQVFIHDAIAESLVVFPVQSFDALSSSDQRLIGLIAQGLPDRQIAAEMHLSLQTIRNRVSRLLHTFQLSNRTQLAVLVAQTNNGED